MRSNTRPLNVLPRLHFDSALALLLFAATLLAQHGQTMRSRAWTASAFWAHECMVGGGIEVFLDRWSVQEYQPALQLWQSPL